MKRVLIFSLNYYPRFIGGAEVALKEITDRIPDIEFHLIANRYDSTLPKVEKIGNVLVHRIGFTGEDLTMADLKKFPINLNKPLYQLLAFWKALSLHRKYKYDAVWAMMAHSTGIPAALFKTVHPEVKYILNLQEGDPPEYIEGRLRLVWPLFSRAFTKADIIQALSNFLAAWARRRGATCPIEVIPNAVDFKSFSADFPPAMIDEVKDRLGKRMGDVFLVTTSRLVHKNAVDDVLRALPMLPENVRFIILGVGPDEEKLHKIARELHIQNRVEFIGHVRHEDLPKFLKASDIFIRPSRSEGMGASFPEAMAAGLPVIATQEGGIADFLFDEKRNPDTPITGWAVDKDSPAQIAEAVHEIMATPEKVRAVVATAREMVKEKYDWDIIAKDMREKVFARLLR
jgi:glycosyltransferase involved in cell wall biosynthesis